MCQGQIVREELTYTEKCFMMKIAFFKDFSACTYTGNQNVLPSFISWRLTSYLSRKKLSIKRLGPDDVDFLIVIWDGYCKEPDLSWFWERLTLFNSSVRIFLR